MRIGLTEDEAKAQHEGIFESANVKLLSIEADPEHSKRLFVFTDNQQILKLSDTGTGKASLLQQIDLSMHEIEDEVALIAKSPYTSCVMSDRITVIDSVNFSNKSTFKWDNVYAEGSTLLSDRNLPGSLH